MDVPRIPLSLELAITFRMRSANYVGTEVMVVLPAECIHLG